MSQEELIQQSNAPQTRSSLANDFRKLGLYEGMTVIVHSSMRSLGWVCGGPAAIIHALQDVITSKGTIIMPAHSGDISDSREWSNPAIPEEWIPEVMKELPPFDPDVTPTFGMGTIPEAFRTYPNVRRSYHPALSFSVWGKNRGEIASNHSLDNGLGDKSPLAYIYRNKGYVLMLGTDYGTNTSMHYGEHKAAGIKEVHKMSPILENGQRVWKKYKELDYDEEKFPAIGEKFEKEFAIWEGYVGEARSKLIYQPDLVDFTGKNIK